MNRQIAKITETVSLVILARDILALVILAQPRLVQIMVGRIQLNNRNDTRGKVATSLYVPTRKTEYSAILFSPRVHWSGLARALRNRP